MKSHAKISCAAIALATIATGASAEPNTTFRKKMSGFEFGVGAPLVTPLTGYNVFFGYVNKNASTFLGRRFGIRADFTVPSTLSLNGTLSNNPNKDGYLADAHGTVMGFDLKLSDFSDKKIEIDAFKDDDKQAIKITDNAIDFAFKMKNQNMGLLIDFYPFADTWFLGGLRLTGGYYLGDFDISINANINDNIDYRYKVGNKGKKEYHTDIKPSDYLHAQIAKGSRIGADFHWKYHGPYAGLGFDLGIWHGFKFFMDAGVVFAKAPKITDRNIHDKDLILKGRYEVANVDYTNSENEMVTILEGATEPTPEVIKGIVHDTVSIAVHDIFANDDKYGDIIDQISGFTGADTPEKMTALLNGMGDDIIDFLEAPDGTKPADWIDLLLQTYGDEEITATIKDIKSEWHENINGGFQKDIHKAWEDYEENKQKAIKEANDFLDDYGIIPMVKIGFMYRF